MERFPTRRFVPALIIMAAIATAGYVVVGYHSSTAAQDATTIHLAGRQRMLSSQVAFFASQLVLHREDAVRSQQARQGLADAVEKMRQEHEALLSLGRFTGCPAVQALHHDPPVSLGRRVESFMQAARRLGRGGDLASGSRHPGLALIESSLQPLSEDLNQAVMAYAACAEKRIVVLRWLEAGSFAALLAGLALTGLLVFRPMARRIDASMRSLSGATQRMRAILDAAGQGICGIDDSGSILFINAAALDMLGYGETEVLGRNFHDLAHSRRLDGRPCPADECPIVLAGRQHVEARAELDALWRKDGTPFPAEMLVAPLIENGAPAGAVIVFGDISARKAAEASIRHYAAELERSNRDLDDFAYIASHDLKEPLRGIHNYAAFLLEDYRDRLDDEGRRYLGTLQQLATRLGNLIDTLLHYSRIGRSEPSDKACDLGRCVMDALAALRMLLDETQGEVVMIGSLPVVRGDPVLWTEVFQNLIANGLKYNTSLRRRVEIGCDRSGEAPALFVRDNGIGIADKHQGSVFRIFKRLHARGHFGGGSGAGLTIVKKIVEQHGGRIWLESAPGQGTTFHFTLGKGRYDQPATTDPAG